MLLNIQNYRDFFDAQFLEQYFTASQFNLHFFLQLNGKLHVTHTFHSRFFFINTLVVEVEGSIGSSVDLRNEAARLKTAEKMNIPPVKTKKLTGCHFWDKQPLSAMISPTTKTSPAASQKQSTPPAGGTSEELMSDNLLKGRAAALPHLYQKSSNEVRRNKKPRQPSCRLTGSLFLNHEKMIG